ncbi:MAG: hypothetical protein ACRCZP_11290 [Phycicoccus sp.]
MADRMQELADFDLMSTTSYHGWTRKARDLFKAGMLELSFAAEQLTSALRAVPTNGAQTGGSSASAARRVGRELAKAASAQQRCAAHVARAFAEYERAFLAEAEKPKARPGFKVNK